MNATSATSATSPTSATDAANAATVSKTGTTGTTGNSGLVESIEKVEHTDTNGKTAIPKRLDARVLARTLEEGYGPGAWHGNDLKAALADVPPGLAFWRPAPGRHNIAEIALHHAYFVRQVRGQLSGETPEPFVLKGDDGKEDWFTLDPGGRLSWPRVKAALETEQERLADVVAALVAGRGRASASAGSASAASSASSASAQASSTSTLAPSASTQASSAPLSDGERFDLALGLTCHAVYHAGQVQLLKRLHAG